jgi:hypothetical protein
MDALRAACAEVARRARFVAIDHDRIPGYAAALALDGARDAPAAGLTGGRESVRAAERVTAAERERRAAFWLTLDAINFGSGWFPTLRKRDGASGYRTIARGVREQFENEGGWSAAAIARITTAELASVLHQDPGHELMALFAASLTDLGGRIERDHGGSFSALVDTADGSAVRLATTLGRWDCFADSSPYEELTVPFLKRAQIAAADLDRAGAARFGDLERLTMFADNLVPHVLRLDGVVRFDPGLTARIEREELIAHDSPEEVEIRACALHAVEAIVAARPGTTAAAVDQLLWERGGEARYKAAPRHRARCTAY